MEYSPSALLNLPACIAVQFYDNGMLPLEFKKKCCHKYKKKGKKACKSCPRN